MGTVLTRRYEEEEMQVIGRNDEHYRSMVDDREFYGQMQNYNQLANRELNLTEAGNNAGQNAEILVKHDKKSEDWINRRWRPAMGWMYMVVCIFDFILFPIMFTIVQFWEVQAQNDAFRQWQPVTLMGAGLFHMAMGAVLGIAAYGRTKEKLEGATGASTEVNTPIQGRTLR